MSTEADGIDCPNCQLVMILAEAEHPGEPTMAYCPDCGYEERITV